MLDAVASLWVHGIVQAGAMLATGPTHLLAGAALAAVLTLTARLLPRPHAGRAQPAGTALTTLRERKHLRVPRQSDPAAAGHRRPRAPSAPPSAA
jgi:hypothetical protein